MSTSQMPDEDFNTTSKSELSASQPVVGDTAAIQVIAKLLNAVKQQREKGESSAATKRKTERIDLHEAISATVGEFLETYVVIGYDFDQQPVNVLVTVSPKDVDALTIAINKFNQWYMNTILRQNNLQYLDDEDEEFD